MKSLAIMCVLVGCVDSVTEPGPTPSEIDQSATVCGVGATVKGIDVSYYQGNINWTAVAGDGVKYAQIRVSDGLNTIDTKFTTYWPESRAAGVKHGAYQFFRPSQDAIAQADLLLNKIGTPMPDDLPPMIDVEATDGLSAAQVAAQVKLWIDHVTPAIGRAPIVYTGFYFWRDQVGALDETASPLWHAQYTSAMCPNIAPPWTDWKFWQYSSTGSVAGISGNVDMDRFNGSEADLMSFIGPARPCGTIDAEGGTIDDGDACFTTGGPPASLRHVSNVGEGDDLVWTHTTSDAAEANFAQWNMNFAAAGTYELAVYTSAAYAQSKQAKYIVHAMDGDHTVMIDQTAVDGWQSLGSFPFAQGGDQFVHLGDNTGEALAGNVQLVFDELSITPAGDGNPDGGGSGSGSGSGSDDGGGKHGGGCNAGGGGSTLLGVGLVGLIAIRRRRR